MLLVGGDFFFSFFTIVAMFYLIFHKMFLKNLFRGKKNLTFLGGAIISLSLFSFWGEQLLKKVSSTRCFLQKRYFFFFSPIFAGGPLKGLKWWKNNFFGLTGGKTPAQQKRGPPFIFFSILFGETWKNNLFLGGSPKKTFFRLLPPQFFFPYSWKKTPTGILKKSNF